jgi:hypothetical protein
MSAQEGQSDVVKRTSVESTAQDDDFQEVKRLKRHISNNTWQTAKSRLNQSQDASKSKHCFGSVKVTDMDTETTEVDNKLPEQKAPRKRCRLPPIVMTSPIVACAFVAAET